MTPDDALRTEAEILFQYLGSPDAHCSCHEIDFTDWPKDIREACSYCRTIDRVVAAFKEQRAAGFGEGFMECLTAFEKTKEILDQRAKKWKA